MEQGTLIYAYSPRSITAVPEPSTWAMMLLGLAGLGFAGVIARQRRVALLWLQRCFASADRDGSLVHGLGIDYQKQRGSGASSRLEQPPFPTRAGFEFSAEDVASHDGSLSSLR